ncbi:PLDc_N domain-containing protein [Mucilaginibacter conchicola]|uniref:PLDc_N domain-containing protein n=1 Tax=Mucilaginibacter conchicola TaxID=2303333 RepID=A0A372NT82_9SPHI|nr:PLD nuclease N-terminal domain-containing protein [Mucilaginibacter conchicola]RFZ92465.1 PLDc_N domain-containing protein [Mucilaginibacter conchicola]
MFKANMVLAEMTSNSWMIFILALGIAYFGFVLFCLMDVLKATFKDPIQKFVWIAVIVCFPFLGSIIYLYMGRKNKIN